MFRAVSGLTRTNELIAGDEAQTESDLQRGLQLTASTFSAQLRKVNETATQACAIVSKTLAETTARTKALESAATNASIRIQRLQTASRLSDVRPRFERPVAT